ncbi:MAG: hypothetical protein FJ098_08750, partial [Deltaproteobacteria bacterium]|nr:hypothetical protein [Deltaproteobacteria bacterium]
MIPGLLMSLLAASLSAPPEEMGAPAPLLPWAVTDRAFEQARYLELEGKPRVAAATVAGTCDGAVSPEAAYLGGVLYEGAGETALALRCLRQVAAADHPLRPRAAWHLHVLETPAEGKTSPADPWLALASSPGLAGRVALARARSLEAAGSRRAAAALLTRALAGPLLPSEALETRLLLARCLTGHGERARGRELLARLAWEGSAEAAEALREEEPLAALDVQDHRRWVGLTPEEAAGRRAGGDPGGWTPEQRLREGVALLGSRERREDALAHLLSARDAAEGNLRIAATWHAAVALEKLDRDLEALALLEELRDLPGLPFATELRVRMGRLCLREALPDRGREVLEEALADASPGTDLSEAVWSLARYHRTAGEPRRCLDLLRLLRRGFTIQRSPWETWGPLALYWEARTLDGLGRREAAIRLWELLWAAAPMNFYGVLSRARLEDASHAPAPPGPATWNAPPLEIGPLGSLDREVLALPLALWRLGRYGEAREETRALLASGRLTPALPALHASLQLRGDGLRSAASLRRSMGTLLPPPWRGGARLWIGSLPVRFLDLLAPVAAGDGGGMDPSIIA